MFCNLWIGKPRHCSDIKGRKLTTIRTLLKSLPASNGMSRPRLFQVVDIVPTQNCVLVTFQKADKQLVEDRQFDLEAQLSDQLASGQASKLFIDITQGLRYGHAYHKQRGKVIKIHNPSQTHLDFVQHADRLLASGYVSWVFLPVLNPLPHRSHVRPV